MRMFRNDGRTDAPEADRSTEGAATGPAWLERARTEHPQRPDAAGMRASQAAASGHTWAAREPARPGATLPRPLSSVEWAPQNEAAAVSRLSRGSRMTDAAVAHAPDAPESEAPDHDVTEPAVSAALARHGEEAFAARARLAAHQAAMPRRRRIWEMDDDAASAPEEPPADRPGQCPETGAPTGSAAEAGDWLDRIGRDERAPRPRAAWDRAASEPAAPEQPGARMPPAPSGTEAYPPRRHAPAPEASAAWQTPAAHALGTHARHGGAPHVDPSQEPQASSAPCGDDDEVAYARAQLARMADVGLSAQAGGIDTGNARAKTRVLGFRPPESDDPFAHGQHAQANRGPDFPVGWLVVTDGAGRGASFALTSGVATLGRGEEQTVRLDFGDTAISRNAHASLAFDEETGRFFLGAGAKSNLVRRNGRPVLATEELDSGDEIRLGETTLRLVALCGAGFRWTDGDAGDE